MSTQKKVYLPPAKRKQEIKENGLSQEELNSENLFPTLCETGKAQWTGKTFKATIDDLIALEKLTAHEKAAQEEARKAMEGWARLSLNLTKEDYIRFNEKIETIDKIAKGMDNSWFYTPSHINYNSSKEKDDDEVSVSSVPEDDEDDE